jgi:hypothetical protein
MSGIPVYTQSPITAAKASGGAPQTAAPQVQTSPLTPNPAPAVTTASASTYPLTRPGGVAFPGPTAAAQLYSPSVQPTPTTQTGQMGDEGPPPPQPGSVPAPLGKNQTFPPPKAGESYAPQETGAAVPIPGRGQLYPPQMGISSPTAYGAQPPSSSTSATTTASASYPVAIPAAEVQRRSLEHPPGYQQNLYASEPASDQRRAQEANASRIGVQDAPENVGGMEFLNTAKKWAQQAGEKISEAEKEVWRKINKE